jgi:hypothetical protein
MSTKVLYLNSDNDIEYGPAQRKIEGQLEAILTGECSFTLRKYTDNTVFRLLDGIAMPEDGQGLGNYVGTLEDDKMLVGGEGADALAVGDKFWLEIDFEAETDIVDHRRILCVVRYREDI